MISADSLMYGFGMFMILGAAFLAAILIFRKSIRNYPVLMSVYVFMTILFLFLGVITIRHIEITGTMNILIFAAIFIWGYITYRLPAEKEEKKNETNKGI